MKTCTQCDEEKPLAEFYFRKERGTHRAACKDCERVKSLAYHHATQAEHGERRRKRKREQRYGITQERYEQMLEAQHGGCAICGKLPGDKELAVDHCHRTGEVRGLLCAECNTGIGLLQDDADMLLGAATYLLKNDFGLLEARI